MIAENDHAQAVPPMAINPIDERLELKKQGLNLLRRLDVKYGIGRGQVREENRFVAASKTPIESGQVLLKRPHGLGIRTNFEPASRVVSQPLNVRYAFSANGQQRPACHHVCCPIEISLLVA